MQPLFKSSLQAPTKFEETRLPLPIVAHTRQALVVQFITAVQAELEVLIKECVAAARNGCGESMRWQAKRREQPVTDWSPRPWKSSRRHSVATWASIPTRQAALSAEQRFGGGPNARTPRPDDRRFEGPHASGHRRDAWGAGHSFSEAFRFDSFCCTTAQAPSTETRAVPPSIRTVSSMNPRISSIFSTMGGGERNSVEENSRPARTMRLRHPTPMNCVLARSTASDRSGSWHRPSNAPCNVGSRTRSNSPFNWRTIVCEDCS